MAPTVDSLLDAGRVDYGGPSEETGKLRMSE